MQLTGKLVVCDRCGKKAFRKYIGREEFDGGYTVENKFEELKDWKTIPDLKFLSQSRADVCPSCYEEYKRILTKYYSSGENLAPVDDIKIS